MNQFIRFILVGIVNSGLGYGIIFACMYLAGLSPELSNAIGYMIALVASYFFHRSYTFRSTQQQRAEFIYFVVVFLIAYCINLAALIVLVRTLAVNAGVSQIISGCVYALASYLLNKHYVFVNKNENNNPTF